MTDHIQDIHINLAQDKIRFEAAFKEHYKGMVAYACSMLKDPDASEEVVQQVFYKLWKNRDEIVIRETMAGYLYRCTHNDCLNYLKHEKVKHAYKQYISQQMNEGTSPNDTVRLKELQQKLDTALKELPEQCRTIFQLSRFEELKYHEIASKLGISVKTVENQMGKALKILRNQLSDYLPAALTILILTF